MNKIEFNAEIVKINNQIELLNAHKRNVEKQFIEDNKKFEVGDKVKYHNKIGSIAEIELSFGGNVGYKINKIKKNGDVSTRSISHIFVSGDEIERF